jgi:HPt (histidine-containing phosphotransfer) domain-containing protein
LADDELPKSLPGFDLASGLERLMGNKRLYRKLLRDFGSKYTEVAGEIRNALDEKDFEQAHSLVHNLKGLAGNLSATDLQAAAVEMEKLVKGSQATSTSAEQLHQKFTELEYAINQALEAVQVLGPSTEDKTAKPSADVLAAVPPDMAKQAAARIKDAADMGDFTQVKSIAEEMKSQSNVLVPFCDKLIQQAEDFDFDGILELINELES